MKKQIILSAGTLLLALTTQAQKELKTSAINLFKNGTYFIVKEGAVNAPKGNWSMSMNNFNPLLATFWVTTGKENPIDRIEFMTDTIHTTRLVQNFYDILSANRGKKLQLTYIQGTTPTSLKGTLENFYASTGIAKIKNSQGGYAFLSIGTLTELSFDDNPSERVKSDSLARVAKIFFDKEKNNMPIKITYMQSGMSWVPSYNIKIVDDNKLQLAMNALIENFSEDIKDADLTLTLGAANFKYGSQLDPITQNYVTAGGVSPYTYTWDNNNNYNYQQAVYSNGLASGAYNIAADAAVPVQYNDYNVMTTAGEKEEDLYRYKLGRVDIPKNSKTSFSIFSNEVPYEDIYEINLADIVNYAANQRINISEDQVFDVFHSLKITNTTDVPFTTGPVFVQDKNLQPLAQDQIKYTPAAGKVKVQLAKATDIQVKQTEEEVSSEEKARKYNTYYYKKVTIKGSIKLENLQQKQVKICVTKMINGDIKETSYSGSTKKSGKYSGLNPLSETEWNITLSKGEKKTITYSYDVYVYQG